MRRSYGPIIALHILAAGLLMSVSSCQPAFAGLMSMESQLGFNGYFQLNHWSPLGVTLENHGRETRATLEVVVTSGSEYRQDVYQTTYATDVELPVDSRKHFTFTVFIQSFAHDLTIRLRQEDRTILHEAINLRPFYTIKPFVIVADNKMVPDFYGDLPESLAPVSVDPRTLPETWFGYDGVNCLIISAESLGRLNDRQFQALTRWTSQGGYLVTAGGLNVGSLSQTRTQELLRLRIRGHKLIDKLPSLADFCGQSLSSPGPLLVLDAELEESQVLVYEKNIPIVSEKSLGRGKIIFLAFDVDHPSFGRWDGRAAFWNEILTRQPAADTRGIVLDQQRILRCMASGMPAEFPGFWSAFAVMGVYLLLLRFLVKGLTRPNSKPRLYPLGLGGLILVFSIAGYTFFFRPVDRKDFAYNSFSHLDLSSGSPAAVGKYTIGLYALRDTAYAVAFESGAFPIRPLTEETSGRKAPVPFTLQRDSSGQRVLGFAPRWSQTFFALQTAVQTTLSGQAVMDAHQVVITIDNRTAHALKDCLIYVKKRFVPVGDIPANKTYVHSIELSELKKIELFAPPDAESIARSIQSGHGARYVSILQKELSPALLLAIDAKYRSSRDIAMLTAWVQTGIVRPRIYRPDTAGEDVTLINCEIPLRVIS
jgi:hypothetical protein